MMFSKILLFAIMLICQSAFAQGSPTMNHRLEIYYFPFKMHADPAIDKKDIATDRRKYFEISDDAVFQKMISFFKPSNQIKYQEHLTRLGIISKEKAWFFDMDGNGIGPSGGCVISDLDGFERWMQDTSGLVFNLFSSKFESPQKSVITIETIKTPK